MWWSRRSGHGTSHPPLASRKMSFRPGNRSHTPPDVRKHSARRQAWAPARPTETNARRLCCVVEVGRARVRSRAAVAFTVEHLGAERVLGASDYPHPDAKIPGVVKELPEALAPLPREAQRVVAGASARAFYHL